VQTSAAKPPVEHDAPSPPAPNDLPSRRLARSKRRRKQRRSAFAVLIVLALVVALVGVVAASSSSSYAPSTAPTVPTAPSRTGSHPGVDARPFSADGFWNREIPDDAALASDSAQLVTAFNHQWQTFYGTVGINTNAYSIPIYTVPADQPTTKVTIKDASLCHQDAGLSEQFAAVPIPSDAQPATGDDSSMAIYQPDTDTAWEMWLAERNPFSGEWSACWGGRIEHVSQSAGAFQWPYGVAAAGIAYLGGTIKVSEMRAGEIKHAISVNLVHTKADTQVPPANRNDGNSTASDAIPEGTRFRLDPSIDVTKLGLKPSGVVIARALQRYGMIVTDTAGAVVLVAEDGQPYVRLGQPDPWTEAFAPQDAYQVLSWVPWNRLQVVAPAD
jgi:hypothetical protein